MADMQDRIEVFHGRIRTYYEINETLRSKKDIILARIRKHLSKNDRPTCVPFIQGSYKMKVGICAIEGLEFDIDVGLRFSFDDSKYSSSLVRSWVFDAVEGHTESVEARGPCIRVRYADGYHVDLVCYAWWDDENGNEQYRLAHKDDGWRRADPPGLVEHVRRVREPFEGTEDSSTQTDQFRRVVRCLKRWNDIAIPRESDDKPSGLALVLLTEKYLTGPKFDWYGRANDLYALEQVAQAASGTAGRIVARKPTPEGEEVFGRISDDAMDTLKDRFAVLKEALVRARQQSDASSACKELKSVFGEDFICPESDSGSRKAVFRTSGPAIIPSSSSAGSKG